MEVYRTDTDRRNVVDEVGALDERAAAKFLGICPRKLFDIRKAGHGPKHVRIGKRVCYPRHLLVAWLDAHATEGGAST
jgi:hypothetical protein